MNISTYSTAPVYTAESVQAASLQLLQVMLNDTQCLVTLADTVAFLNDLQTQYGCAATLEDVIQQLVCQQLRSQYEARKRERHMEVAS